MSRQHLRSFALTFLSIFFLLQAQPPIACVAGPVNEHNQASRQQSDKARLLAEQIVAAYGGPDQVKSFKYAAYKSHGTHSAISGLSGAANSLVCDVTGHAEKLRLETKMIGQPMILGYNGKESWTQFGDWVNPASETTLKRLTESLEHGLNLLADLTDPKRKLEYLGTRSAGGKTCDVLRIYADDGKPSTFYADQSTHLILRSEYLGTDHEQGVPAVEAVEYLDYRPVAGTFSPFKTVEYTGSKKTSQTLLDSLELGIKVDDKIFDMPAEIQIPALKLGPVAIPFDYVNNQIIVRVKINSSYCRFIVDTGASQTVISRAAAAPIGPLSQADFSITAGSKAVPLSYLTIPSLTIGDITLTNLAALVTDLSSLAGAVNERPSGLLGANVLRRFLVTFDFKNKVMLLADPHKVTVPSNAYVIKTSPVYGATALVVSGKLDNKLDLNFLVDTGAGFNNLPQSAVKKLLRVSLLPVGKIFGVDGKKLAIGSWRCQNLKLGPLECPDQVFALSPEPSGGGESNGLFTAGAMGILGNPFWSQFKTTIDYRNERLILEPLANCSDWRSIRVALRHIAQKYQHDKDAAGAIKACQSLTGHFHTNHDTAAEAYILSEMAGYYAEKISTQPLAARQLAAALNLAKQAADKEVSGHVLAQWAGYYISTMRAQSDAATAKGLIGQALAVSPADADAYTWLGTLYLRAANLELASRALDQALLLDPSNWRALWSEYTLYCLRRNSVMQQAVLEQIRHYYPDAADLDGLIKPAAKAHPQPAPARRQ